MKTVRVPPPLHWMPLATLTTTCTRRDGKSLNLSLTQEPGRLWIVVVIEAATPSAGAGAGPALEDVLEDHAHKLLEPVRSLGQAIAIAEDYARWWLRTGAVHDECGCEAIDDDAATTGGN